MSDKVIVFNLSPNAGVGYVLVLSNLKLKIPF